MSIKPYFQSKTFETAYNIDLDELEVSLPILKVSQESIKPAKLKRGRGRPRKHPVTENHLTSIDIPVK